MEFFQSTGLKITKKSISNLKKLIIPFNYFFIYSLVESHHWVFSIVRDSLGLPSIYTMGECPLPSSVLQISWRISFTLEFFLFNFFHSTYSTDLRSFGYGGLKWTLAYSFLNPLSRFRLHVWECQYKIPKKSWFFGWLTKSFVQ